MEATPARIPGATLRRWLEAVTTMMVVIVVLGTWFAVERRSPDYDPQFARDIVERQRVFGGSYYQNGIHNKGPLEIWVPSMVRKLFGFDGFWFGIAAVIMVVAVVVGWSGAHLVRRLGGPRWLAAAALGCIFVHLTLSAADYAGVLYSRNMTIGLLAVALICFTRADEHRHADRGDVCRAVVGGAAVGLAVQTLPTAALTGACLLLFSLGGSTRIEWSGRRVRLGWLAVAAAALVFLSAPLYYRVFGPWEDFWDGWFVYGQYMSESTGRSLRNQLGLGWHNFYMYTRDHMPAFLAIVGFIVLGVARRAQLTRRQRWIHVLLVAWWIAAWLEITLTQRYSSHYFAVVALPTALMIAGCAVHLVALAGRAGLVPWRTALLPHALVAFSLYWSGTAAFRHGLEAAERFDGFHAVATQRAAARDGQSRAVQAVLDLTTRADDPMQMWTSRPWWYLNFRRVSATRFIWKSFLMGETYLGRTSPDYVLPGSWDRWAADIAQSNPRVYLVDNDFPMPGDTPADDLLAERFTPVLTTARLDLSLTPAALAPLTAADGMEPWTGPNNLAEQRCRRIDVTADGPITLDFGATADGWFGDQIVIADGMVVARSPRVEYLRTEAIAPPTVRIVVGTSSAAVLFGEQVVAALAYLPSPSVSVSTTGAAQIATGAYTNRGECGR